MTEGAGQNFAKIYERNCKFLSCYLRKRGVVAEDFEDLVQETFLRCFKTILEKPEMEHGRLLITVARNLQIDQYRRHKHQPVAHSPEVLESVPDDRNSARSLMQRAIIEKMVSEIVDQKDSHFFKLHYESGLKLQEIATATGTPVGTVASQVSRFRTKFQGGAVRQLEAAGTIWD